MKFPHPQALEQGNISQLNQLMEEAAVKNYLLNNPDFLRNNAQLLTHIELSHDCEDATSLVERQIKVLRERNQTLQGQLIDMLHAAHNNEKLLIQCNHFMLSLLQNNDLESLCTDIIAMLKQDFSLDDAALILVGDYQSAGPAQIYSNASDIKTLLNCQFPDSQPLCGRLEIAPKKVLFGELSRELQSFALIPLGKRCEFGLLALASNDVSRFEPEMGTLFVELIAKLVTHLTRRYASA
ncbi:DUF484 family protein [Aliikangiella coralliicola]|uniref:DUF484 family protein n=1 Tax=Aliikangiella coralliicola TaxID=2592383 RepID=A0A545UGE6_9GAMM|nr:DUF484 family protein [Aliikangiella coralliicola]TQV88527.1 DUF484 family protein [Aliikangiella coralliicola]